MHKTLVALLISVFMGPTGGFAQTEPTNDDRDRTIPIPVVQLPTGFMLEALPPTTRQAPVNESAQSQTPARTFEELKPVVQAGMTLTVTDGSGRDVTGRLSDLSTTSLALTAGDRILRFDEPDVALIQRRHSDTLANGALIGALAGIAPFVIVVIAETAGGEPCSGQCTRSFLFWGGIGALIGASVDAGVRGNRTIYLARPSTSSPPALELSPILSRGTKGLRLTIRP